MYSNWTICQNNGTGHHGPCEDFQNNCDRCGKWYRYNWRRRRTRDKNCHLCSNEIKFNVVPTQFKAEQVQSNGGEPPARHEESLAMDDANCYHIDKKIWDSPLAMFQCGDTKKDGSLSAKKSYAGLAEFTEQLFMVMKGEFEEELKNPQEACRGDFLWPKTDHLSKVDCLRAFNIMKQILLQEMSACNDKADSPNPLAVRRKLYLERRFQSLEREKIRRMKIYEREFIREERKVCL